jgi:Flp pilus assembly protein TadD
MGHPNVESLLKSAVSSHQAGQLDAAEEAYRSVLAVESDHPHALNLLGVLQHQRGRDEHALELIDRAIAVSRDSWEFHCNRSLVLQALGRQDDAIASLAGIAEVTPAAGPRLELAFLLTDTGRTDEALGILEALVEDHPEEDRAWSRFGALLQRLGRLDEAESACRRAAELAPSRPEVFNNLATVQRLRGRLDEAESNARQSIGIRADFASGWDNLGQVLMGRGDVPGMFEAFSRAAQLRHPTGGAMPPRPKPRLARIRHDYEQIQFLITQGMLDGGFRACAETLETIRQRAPTHGGQLNPPVQISPAEQLSLAPWYDRMLINYPAPAIDGGAVNPDLDLQEIQRTFLERDAPYVVVDDFLKPEAIDRLYRYGMCSTVFFKEYNNGYLTTRMTDGFYSELLVQLVQEIPQRLPDIFGDSRLKEAWIFKCDSRMKALDTHADFAAVNVNIWLTPDSANADPESGGLTIFDKAAPAEWTFETYNSKRDMIARYLEESGATPRHVHYRHNRALIFRSSLFHASEAIHFREGYENRRQNLTLLYGHR